MDFTKEAHKRLKEIIKEGDVLVDATMGNGYDTLFLSDCAGQSGKVFAFDVQEQAVESTKNYLAKNGKNPENTELILRSHEFIAKELQKAKVESISVAIFNLGYLPKGSDKSVTTSEKTTLKALEDSLAFANRENFILSVLSYIAHDPKAKQEFLAVDNFFKANFSSYETFRDSNNEKSPILLLGYAKNMKKNV